MNIGIFLDSALLGGALLAGAAFFLITGAAAFIVFRLLKRTVKLAIRMAIVTAIIAAAVAGSLYFWFSSGTSRTDRPRPPVNRAR